MMKLQHLIDNRDLVHMLLENWDYDRSHLEVLDQYRISANAVYPFISGGNVCFLRFSPMDEKNPDDIRAELDFLSYLGVGGYPAVQTIPSKNARDLEISDTPWGTYSAVVFKGAPGKRLDQMELTEDIIYGIGKSLGQLHAISTHYTPVKHKRSDWLHRLDWIKAVLREFPEETKALEEEALLRRHFPALPVSEENFGLVHYDFETDNLFYDARDGSIHPIDFDDAVYHWYIMDIVQALDSLQEELPESFRSDAIGCFLNGYRAEKAIDDALLAQMPVFGRYANLFCYARILRAVREQSVDEPDWMAELRAHLDCLLDQKRSVFGCDVGLDDLRQPVDK